jgi:hypothetical protein
MLYYIDITFKKGGIACFGVETDTSDTYITRCAPIARKTVERNNKEAYPVIAEYLRRGAKIQKLVPQGWVTVGFTSTNS